MNDEPSLFDDDDDDEEPPPTPPTVHGDPNPPIGPKSTRHITRALRNLIVAADHALAAATRSDAVTGLEEAVAAARASLLASPKVYRNATDTAIAAAAGRAKNVDTASHRRIMALLGKYGPGTDMELEVRWGWDYGPTWTRSGISARRGELRDAGLVRDTGAKRPSGRPGNKQSIVWAVV